MNKLHADYVSCYDKESRLLTRLMVERRWAPYRVPEFAIPAMHACLVHISSFTNDGIDIAYYISQENLEKFLSGTFGMQAYGGPVFLTPIGFSSKETLVQLAGRITVSDAQLRVRKHDVRMETVRWRYLYETGRLQWAKLAFDYTRWETLQNQIQGLSTEANPEAQNRIAITYGEHSDNAYSGENGDCDGTTNTDDGGSFSERMEDDDANRALRAQGSDLDILRLLCSIQESGGHPDDLLAYLARRDKHGNLVGVVELKEKVGGLNDVLSLIRDQLQQGRDNEAAGIELPEDFEEVMSGYYEERDDYLADIYKILGRPEEAKDNSPESEKEEAATEPFFPTLMQQHVFMATVMRATEQDVSVARRLLVENDWKIGAALEIWFSMSANDEHFNKQSSGKTDSDWSNDGTPPNVVAGPSGISSQAECNQAECIPENLAADRARLERLIAQESAPQQDPRAGDTLGEKTRKLTLKISLKPRNAATNAIDLAE